MAARERIDLLARLKLPARYERLVQAVGPSVASLLVPPDRVTADGLARLVSAIHAQDEGVFVPLSGRTGAGKTTLAGNVTQWHPSAFTPTVTYDGPIEFDQLTARVLEERFQLTANDRRTVPVVIDHRESNPPSHEEMAILKRFLRSPPHQVPVAIFWPETDPSTARVMAERYISIAGAQPIPLPMTVEGPDRKYWKDIATNTLKLVNSMDSLEKIGVDPQDYDVNNFSTLGEYLRRISLDFTGQLFELRKSIARPLELLIVFVSESAEQGVLAQFCNSSHYGLLDAGGLLASTPDSVIGRWWADKRGLLTRTIVQLNAHAVPLGPTAAVSALRNCGPSNDPLFETLGVSRLGPGRAVRDLEKTDIGKILLGNPVERSETRGTPASQSLAAFQLLAEQGLNVGKDKALNKVLGCAYRELLTRKSVPFVSIKSEKALDFCSLIPDTSIEFDEYTLCIEYVWRKGDFLSTRRSEAAQYVLTKLKNYATELKWYVP